MTVSARAGGAALAALGLALAAFHVRTIATLWGAPARVVVNGVLPLLLSAAVVAAGGQLARAEVIAEQFVARVLSWVGVTVLAAATAWLFAGVLVTGPLPPNAALTLLNAVTLGGLIGYLVGVYDARRRRQQVRVDQLNRINSTLRIATREIVDADTRGEIEQRVCERLQQSEPYESAWIGRYDPDEDVLTPDAWAGLDDEYYESVVITVDGDDDRGQGAGGRAVRTGEIQCSQDVATDPSMEPWRELFASHGVESVAVVPLTDGESVHGILSVYADRPYVFDEPEREVLTELGETIGHAITSLGAREQLRRRERELATQNDRLAEFASVLSHDLRNPLNVAEGSVALAREDRDTDVLRRAADALDRMNELVEDVLTLARTGQHVSEFATVDLDAVARDAWQTTETASATLNVKPSLGAVAGDESRVRQLFENLFRNAVEHGAPAVTVTVGALDDGMGFYVEDDGPGISEDDHDTVFDAGFSTDAEGTGFGLNIVKSIADAHGWDIRVAESESGAPGSEASGGSSHSGRSHDGGACFEFTGVETDAGRTAEERTA